METEAQRERGPYTPLEPQPASGRVNTGLHKGSPGQVFVTKPGSWGLGHPRPDLQGWGGTAVPVIVPQHCLDSALQVPSLPARGRGQSVTPYPPALRRYQRCQGGLRTLGRGPPGLLSPPSGLGLRSPESEHRGARRSVTPSEEASM